MLTEGGIDVVEAAQEVLPPREFIRSLPEKRRCEEEKQLIILALDHVLEAHVHASMMCAHISSLTKVSNKEMVNLVLHAVSRPLMQLNIPEQFVNPTVDTIPKTTEQEQKEKLEKFILPHTDSPAVERVPKYDPSWLVAAAIWLRFKHNFLNEGHSERRLAGNLKSEKSSSRRFPVDQSTREAWDLKEGYKGAPGQGEEM